MKGGEWRKGLIREEMLWINNSVSAFGERGKWEEGEWEEGGVGERGVGERESGRKGGVWYKPSVNCVCVGGGGGGIP